MLGTLKDWLVFATGVASVAIDFIALMIVIVGTVEAAIGGLRLMFKNSSGHQRRDVWLNYARWLVAALTFQLAADIIETSIAPTWDDVGRLAVIAIVRTLLNYFLEKDLEDIRDRQHQTS
ncbi:MAG TPA: DUF1622 domain-containing protein [Pseudolabrys sp.]|nr:DUF1622 domain-containing protein [Pseudolabrys sp.]